MKFWIGPVSAMALVFAGVSAHADDDPGKPLRLIGQTPPIKGPDGAPGAARRFVIDARVKPGDGEFQSTLEGWFAGLDDDPPVGEISGSCVEKRCAFTVSVPDGKMAFTGDLLDAAAGPVVAHFTVKDDEDKVTGQGAVTLRPVAEPIAGFGVLAAPDAIDAASLDDLLVWGHQNATSGDHPGEPVGESQRTTLADWQKAKNRAGTGLIFEADLTQLRAEAAEARKAAAWTMLGDAAHGWTAGYPAALLTRASHAGAEQRYASTDGKAVLIVAIDPPMSGEAFDALVEKETADNPARTSVGYNRMNNEMDVRYEEKGVVHVMAWHNRDGGLARLSFTYPAAANDIYDPYTTIISSAFVVGDDLKR